MNRRRFLVTAVGAGTATLGGPWLATGQAATDDELAFANFGVSAEFLAKDFYAKAIQAKITKGSGTTVLRRGRAAATLHAKALSELLVAAGDTAPLEEDFTFAWPRRAFSGTSATVGTGLRVLRALLGAYQTASATVTEPSYRALYSSLVASLGQQIGALSELSGRVRVEPFPPALDLEAASAAIESYLG